MVHGILIVLLGQLSRGRLSYPVLLCIGIVTGMAWELTEHTDLVLDRFRGVTIYQGYIGDSVLNSVMDYVWMWCGFFLASAFADLRITVLLVVMIEGAAAVLGRDSLTLTTLQLVYPLEAIDAYQQAINPNRRPEDLPGD
jgi:hypothetical protein